MEIHLPKNEFTWLELEYEKLEKHCFFCMSLLHEKKNCPKAAPKDRIESSDPRSMGINQRKTLNRIDADKRRLDNRKSLKVKADQSKFKRPSYSKRYSPSRDPSHFSSRAEESSQRQYRHHSSPRFVSSQRYVPSHYTRDSRGDKDKYHTTNSRRDFLRDLPAASRPRSNSRRADVYRGAQEPSQRLPSEPPALRRLDISTDEHSSHYSPNRAHTPPRDQRLPLEHAPAQESGVVNSNSRERHPALERIGLPITFPAHQTPRTFSLDSMRMQDIEVRYLDEEMQVQQGRSHSRSGNSTPAGPTLPSPRSISTRLGKQNAPRIRIAE